MTHRRSRIDHRTSGATIVDVLAGVVVFGGFLTLLLPALSQERDDTRIAACANNLRLLAASAHNYADDFDDKFFYHWPFGSMERERTKPYGLWCDQERVGRYIAGEEVGGPPGYDKVDGLTFLDDHFPMGLGGRAFICPADLDGAARSYGMNFWASGAGDVGEEKFPQYGELFDRTSEASDQLLLFTEVLSGIKVRKGWVTHGLFGARLYPGQRFGGKGGYGMNAGNLWERFHIQEPITDLDYSRHSPQSQPGGNIGVLNIAYADGHVALKQNAQLYREDTGRSTLDTLWSPIDPHLVDR